jgi:hypothetical protein
MGHELGWSKVQQERELGDGAGTIPHLDNFASSTVKPALRSRITALCRYELVESVISFSSPGRCLRSRPNLGVTNLSPQIGNPTEVHRQRHAAE